MIGQGVFTVSGFLGINAEDGAIYPFIIAIIGRVIFGLEESHSVSVRVLLSADGSSEKNCHWHLESILVFQDLEVSSTIIQCLPLLKQLILDGHCSLDSYSV